MDKVTEENLKNAFAGESQAHMKYTIFAETAEKEGKAKVARLFRAIAYAEYVHARNHLKALGGIQKTGDNLVTARQGEVFEVEKMYPGYYQNAKAKGDREAEISFHYALEAEKIHAVMYEKAKAVVDSGKDIEVKDLYICPVCGYTEEGAHVDVCPVCKVKRELFKKF